MSSVFFDFGTIIVKILAIQTNVSGDDSGFGWLTETERKQGNYALVRREKYSLVRRHNKQWENEGKKIVLRKWIPVGHGR